MEWNYPISAVWGLLIGIVNVFLILIIGLGLLKLLRVDAKLFKISFAFCAGIAVNSLLFTSLSLSRLAYAWVLLVVWIGVPILCILFLPGILGELQSLIINFWYTLSELPIFLKCIFGILLFYVATFSLTPYRGADLAIYHLVIPDRILAHHGYILNPDFFGQGIPLGWHHVGLVAFLLGGEAGYLSLSLMVYLFTLHFIYKVIEWFFPFHHKSFYFIGAWLAGISIAVGSRGSISNTDLPGLMSEGIAIIACFYLGKNPKVTVSLFIGLLAGLAISIKLMAAVSIIFGLAYYIFSIQKNRLLHLVAIFVGGALLACIWLVISMLETGSPLPVFMNTFYLTGGIFNLRPLPQITISSEKLAEVYGDWMKMNYWNRFTGPALGLSIFYLFGLFSPILILKKKEAWVGRILLGFTLMRFGLLFLMTRRVDIVFHDRYHMMSYLIILILGWVGFYHFSNIIFSSWQGFLVKGIVCVIVFSFLLFNQKMTFPKEPDFTAPELKPNVVEEVIIPPAWQEISQGWAIVTPWWKLSPIMHKIESLPKDSVIATISVAPYHYRRDFIQLLPMSQHSIDLMNTPEEILEMLIEKGATHLHLPPTSGLIPGMVGWTEQWLQSVRKIPQLPGVTLLIKQNVGTEQLPLYDAIYILPTSP